MKAILVVNLPEDVFIDDCRIEFRVIENVMNMCVEDGVKRLRPMPQKKEAKGDFYKQREIVTGLNDLIDFDKGYNKCIDEILGE